MQKRMIAINDLSCFGKCSLTVAVPILSAAGVETCVLPTALLSSHTAFCGYTFRDLTEDMIDIVAHWKEMNLTFDGIYTGYLGNVKQVDAVEKIIDLFPTEFVLIDPVMGDNGKLYDGFDRAFVEEMKRLVKKADVIVPNMTEGALLADMPYESGIHTRQYLYEMVEKLQKICTGNIVLTGVNTAPDCVGTAVFDGKEIYMAEHDKIHAFYSGTGDVFASVFAAAILFGRNVREAAEIATQHVMDCIKKTKETSGDRNYGLNFELCTENLLKTLKCIS